MPGGCISLRQVSGNAGLSEASSASGLDSSKEIGDVPGELKPKKTPREFAHAIPGRLHTAV